MILGVDVGLHGALALIDDDDMCRQIWDMPTTPKTHGKGEEVNARLLADIVDEAADSAKADITVYIEAVSSMPGQGVASMFSFGQSFGIVLGVVAALGLQYRLVRPQQWKRSMGLIKRDKGASRALAMQRYPEVASSLSRVKDDGRAEALLIAAWGLANG